MEREKQEEAKSLQEMADQQRDGLKRQIQELKASEERLKMELKLAKEEAKKISKLEM